MIYKSSIVIERMDYLMMEQDSGEPVFPRSEFRAMIGEVLCTPIEPVSYTHLTLPTNREV